MDRPIIVYVSGNNASGKTTFGKAIARALQWTHLPEERFNLSYLDDLFVAERRWSFEAQMHFLTHKVATVRRATSLRTNALIDRSPYEDSEVFAEHFYFAGGMDDRAIESYRRAAAQFLADLPEPDLIIYCEAPLETLEKRVASRGRQYEERYPAGHLAELQVRYDAWLNQIAKKYPGRLVTINTAEHNFAEGGSSVVQVASRELICHLIRVWHLTNGTNRIQLGLFPEADLIKTAEIRSVPPCGLRDYLSVEPLCSEPKMIQLWTGREMASPAESPTKKKRRAYIAAPFTNRATVGSPYSANEEEFMLPGLSPARRVPHGKITDRAYRQWLEDLERIAKAAGFITTLPHRDVNKWGDRTIDSAVAARECTRQVLRSDVVVAMPSTSYGVHYEVGIAAGAGIPIILLTDDLEQLSFLMKGMSSVGRTIIIAFRDLEELRLRLTQALSVVKK
ncbi:MAG: deoxynucleoside kinase [Acidobacteriia bacterium]|nr:deoxynucleoside kinase [Terriglobia bacterium]